MKKLSIRKLEELKTTGNPAPHGLTGREFGEAVSGLAKTDPAALVDHVRGLA